MMSRSQRLLDLIQILRRHRGVVSGAVLAREAGVSLRTIRRDIVTLQAMGADIASEAGVGYALRPGFVLPPLVFTHEELQALMLGAEWVGQQTDVVLAAASRNAIAKIAGVLPPHLLHGLDNTSVYIQEASQASSSRFDLAQCRLAIREQRKMRILVRDDDGAILERIVWPVMLGFEGGEHSFAAWCEHDQAYRIFAADRMVEAKVLDERYLGNRRQMVKEWLAIAATVCGKASSEQSRDQSDGHSDAHFLDDENTQSRGGADSDLG
ncbi:YafY family protein [Methylovorus sp. MP688]|uniref:helix-turn-helix transcriptional regulator n=1 Tax=Methylovorus sp. (strain MP688) TaxID=887061 RepID=UPI001EE68795|nr:YafY family protein [Methylovorus sp. MP688]